jgi:hypothetical protein
MAFIKGVVPQIMDMKSDKEAHGHGVAAPVFVVSSWSALLLDMPAASCIVGGWRLQNDAAADISSTAVPKAATHTAYRHTLLTDHTG